MSSSGARGQAPSRGAQLGVLDRPAEAAVVERPLLEVAFVEPVPAAVPVEPGSPGPPAHSELEPLDRVPLAEDRRTAPAKPPRPDLGDHPLGDRALGSRFQGEDVEARLAGPSAPPRPSTSAPETDPRTTSRRVEGPWDGACSDSSGIDSTMPLPASRSPPRVHLGPRRGVA